jgi:hypothetical protein
VIVERYFKLGYGVWTGFGRSIGLVVVQEAELGLYATGGGNRGSALSTFASIGDTLGYEFRKKNTKRLDK